MKPRFDADPDSFVDSESLTTVLPHSEIERALTPCKSFALHCLVAICATFLLGLVTRTKSNFRHDVEPRFHYFDLL